MTLVVVRRRTLATLGLLTAQSFLVPFARAGLGQTEDAARKKAH